MSNFNLVKLYTPHGNVFVDTLQLTRKKTHLTMYNSRGEKLSEVGKTREIREWSGFGVHIENLFASRKHADAASDKVWRELYGENALTTKQLREMK